MRSRQVEIELKLEFIFTIEVIDFKIKFVEFKVYVKVRYKIVIDFFFYYYV